jgi:hypothetical protein
MCVSKTLERGVAVRFREFVRCGLRTTQEKSGYHHAHLPLPEMRDAEDKTRSTQ